MAVYPDFPNNRLIVGGVDLSTTFQLVLSDGYTLSPPEPKTYTVDIPGGDGSIDLTSALTGHPVYNNRQQQFTFYVLYPEDFEQTKTRVYNYLHGKTFDYTMTMDPEYTYRGRFTVSDPAIQGDDGTVQLAKLVVSVEAEPYKLKEVKTYSLNAAGGKTYTFYSGEKPVRPTVECASPMKLIFNGETILLSSGTYRLSTVLFESGANQLYIESVTDYKYTWEDVGQGGWMKKTWAELYNHTWSMVHKITAESTILTQSWQDCIDSATTWGALDKVKKWSDMSTRVIINEETGEESDDTVYLQYEWRDL